MPDELPKSITKPYLWTAVFVCEILWCFLAGCDAGTLALQRVALLCAAVGFGTVLGVFSAFLFTSSGKEEEATFGRIRDWMLAGITGAGAAEVMEGGGSVKRLLLVFSPGSQQGDFALVLSTVVFGFGAGFFFMFFQRELNLNVLLAKARAVTANAEGAKSASIAVHELLAKLPTDLLTYVNDVSESGLSEEDRKKLEDLLNAEDVQSFLSQTSDRLSSGGSLDWDSISKAAFIQYYKTYFVPKESRKGQIQIAETWFQRALLIQPNYAALTIANADLKALEKDFASAVKILRDLVIEGDPPATTLQLLGYYLLEDGDFPESTRFSRMYLELYPDDSSTLFNLAYSFGRMFCEDQQRQDCRTQFMKYLARGLSIDPSHVVSVKEGWIQEGLQCVQGDKEFTDLLAKATAEIELEGGAKAPDSPDAQAKAPAPLAGPVSAGNRRP